MLKTENARNLYKVLDTLGVVTIVVSDGNEKLKPTPQTGYIIWNIPARITCPWRTKDCEQWCYAAESERIYPGCLPARMRNLELTKEDDFVLRMTFTILKRRKYSRKRWIKVRIHESGDFYNRKYLSKWLRIMKNCEGEDIIFYAYTKSFPVFAALGLTQAKIKELYPNFRLRASTDESTPQEMADYIEENGWNTYDCRYELHNEEHVCRCEDCDGCNLCLDDTVRHIVDQIRLK